MRTRASQLLGVASRYASALHNPVNKATIMDGKSVADKIKQEVAMEVTMMKETAGKVPGLGVILVGTRRDSEIYVYNKTLACTETGISSSCAKLPENTSEEEVVSTIKKYNDDPSVHGILVQLPLPKHLNQDRILSAVNIEKDVDGTHPFNIGALALQSKPLFVPCTAKACIQLLLCSGISISGKHAVVIGRSNIVGLPASLLLQHHNATVTTVHELTANPEEHTQQADIILAAAGSPNLVRGHWLKPGAVVLDIGINHVQRETSGEFYIVGDVCFEEACKTASAISPVPGGVGPVTIAMLLQNTIEATKSIHGLHDFKT